MCVEVDLGALSWAFLLLPVKVINILSPHKNLSEGASALGHFPLPVFLLYLNLPYLTSPLTSLDFVLLQP